MKWSNTELIEKRDVELTESEQHELLADERRRIALEVLANRTDATTLEHVATKVAARSREHGMPTKKSVRHVKTALHHVHLPKLDDHGIVQYDPTSHRIEL